MNNNNFEKKITLLDWCIVFSVILLFISVYVPQIIWQEEEMYKKESRFRMSMIANAAEFYYELTNNYTNNGEHLFFLVEAAMDSLIADSLFTDNQIIYNSEGIGFEVSLERGFELRVDTTFSKAVDLKRSYLDTVYTVGMKNELNASIDTLFVNSRDLALYKKDSQFYSVFDSDTITRSEIITNYLRKKYHLTTNYLFCPLTGDPYLLEIDSTDQGDAFFIVKSPIHLLEEPYTESRYGIFRFESGKHGYIKGGIKSWAGE